MFSLMRYSYSIILVTLLWATASFGQENVLAQVSRFPEDLISSQGVDHEGIYSDGWVAASACIVLRQPSGTFFRLKGLIPQISNSAFSTQLEVLIDRRLVITKMLGCGEFTIEASILNLTSNINRRIELRYTKTQLLPAPDARAVAAQLFQVGFVTETLNNPASTRLKSATDIIAPAASGQIALGAGWYESEKMMATPFRWVNNNAEIVLDMLAGKAPATLELELEPGPGVSLKPFELLLFRESSSMPFEKITVQGRETVRFNLPFSPNTTEVITLKVEGGGQLIPQELRVLNFRVFKIKLSESQPAPAAPQPAAATHAQKRNGMFDDGWVSKHVEFKLPQLFSPGILVLRGSIPVLSATDNLANEVIIKVDDKIIAQEKLKQGTFEITTSPISGGGIRKVELIFLNEFKLPNTDQRIVSALIEQVTFEKLPTITEKK